MWKGKRFFVVFAIVAVFVGGLSLMRPLVFWFAFQFEQPPMNEEQVAVCFEQNYEALVVVAGYLERVDYDGQIEIMAYGETPRVRKRVDSGWTDVVDGEIEDVDVVQAIEHLRGQGYRGMRRNGEVISFRRDGTGRMSRYGRVRVDVVYSMDGSDLRERSPRYSPLPVANWFVYIDAQTAS